MKHEHSQLPEIRVSYRRGENPFPKISSYFDAYHHLKQLYDLNTIELQEYSYVLYLNRANTIIGWYLLSKGGTCTTVIDLKILFSVALGCGASYFILSHNHPSGTLTPSEPDIRITKRVKEVGELLDIGLLDHIIITKDSFFSFSNEGLL
jgi:DNA repair protein RadC